MGSDGATGGLSAPAVVVVPTVGGGRGGVVGGGTVVGATVSGIDGVVHGSFVGVTLTVGVAPWVSGLRTR